MEILKNWKRAAAVTAAAIMLSGSFAMPVMAHGHGSSHHGTYCAYHGTTHSKKTSCSRYCTVHKTTHSNGKLHCSSHH